LRSIKKAPLLAFASLLFVGCSESNQLGAAEIRSHNESLIRSSVVESERVERQCLVEQGFRARLTESTSLTVVAGGNGLSPAAELESLTDIELLKRIDFSTEAPKPRDPALDRIRFQSVVIQGKTIDGGCFQWAQQKVGETRPLIPLARKFQDDLQSRVQSDERFLSLKREWKECLTGDAAKLVAQDGEMGFGELQVKLAYDVLPLLSTKNLSEVRRKLAVLSATQDKIIQEAKRCSNFTKYLRRFDKLNDLLTSELIEKSKYAKLAER
jgi:hypothetical protein